MTEKKTPQPDNTAKMFPDPESMYSVAEATLLIAVDVEKINYRNAPARDLADAATTIGDIEKSLRKLKQNIIKEMMVRAAERQF